MPINPNIGSCWNIYKPCKICSHSETEASAERSDQEEKNFQIDKQFCSEDFVKHQIKVNCKGEEVDHIIMHSGKGGGQLQRATTVYLDGTFKVSNALYSTIHGSCYDYCHKQEYEAVSLLAYFDG